MKKLIALMMALALLLTSALAEDLVFTGAVEEFEMSDEELIELIHPEYPESDLLSQKLPEDKKTVTVLTHYSLGVNADRFKQLFGGELVEVICSVDEYSSKLQNMIAAGNPPDLVVGESCTNNFILTLVKPGLVQPFDPYIDYSVPELADLQAAYDAGMWNDQHYLAPYYDLRNCLYFVRGRMDKLAPGMVKSFNVGEGQFIMDGGKPAFRLAMAQDASSYSASWTAHMFDAMTEQGFEYFANWAWAADWFYTKEAFLPIPAWFPANFMAKMAGGKRIGAEGFVLNKTGNTVGGFGSLQADGTLRLMLYNHNIDRADSDEALTVTLNGLGGAYACEAEQIDASTCFFRDWEAKSAHIQRAARDVDIATVGSVYDSDIASILKPEDKAYWRSMKAKYAAQPQTATVFLAVEEGKFTVRMPGHSVLMLTITPEK